MSTKECGIKFNGAEIKMDKQFFFMAGLPRSGSTLLTELFNQNPKIYSGPNSVVIELIHLVHEHLEVSEEFNNFPSLEAKQNIVSSIIKNNYQHIDKPIIIDKNFHWGTIANFNYIQQYITKNPKIIFCVRDILEVLTSFIELLNKNPNHNNYIDVGLNNHMYPYRTLDDRRCDFLMHPGGAIDKALFSIEHLLNKKDNVMFVEYNDLVGQPQETMSRIYKFLKIENYEHNFDNLKNTLIINDNVYGIKDMHTIRKTIKKVSKKPEDVLSDYILSKYSNYEFWRNGK
jgi:sulfotransferase